MIPAALLVVALPALAAVPVYALRRARTLEMLISVGACGLVIALLSAQTERVALPGVTIDIGAALNILGREMRVRAADRGTLALLFGCAALLFGITWRARQGWTYTTIGLIVLSLLSAGLLVRPFVFSALAFVAASAMLAIMIQSESDEDNLSGQVVSRTLGAVRFLTIAAVALPLFLAASYLVARATNITTDTDSYARAAAFLAVGFVLLFGAFPLFTWTHPVANEAPPLTTAFIASIATAALAFLFLALRQEFAWFASDRTAMNIVRAAGLASLVFGGALAWAQNAFGRVIACAISLDIGTVLLLLSYGEPLGVSGIALGTVSRALSFGLLGFGLALLRERAPDDRFEALRGVGNRNRLAALAVVIGGLSMVGLPGTLGFLTRWAGARVMASRHETELLVVLVVAIGSVGIGLLRGIIALLDEPPTSNVIEAEPVDDDKLTGRLRFFRERLSNRLRAGIIIGVGVVALVGLGVFPAALGQLAQALAAAYTLPRP